jgi:hypothetical protein
MSHASGDELFLVLERLVITVGQPLVLVAFLAGCAFFERLRDGHKIGMSSDHMKTACNGTLKLRNDISEAR